MSNARIFCFLLGLLLLYIGWATDPSKAEKALNALRKGRYEKAEKMLTESLEKDSLNPAVHYVYALLYSTQGFKDYHLDTAYGFVQKALRQWSLLNEKELRMHKKKGFSYMQFEELLHKVDSLSFLEVQNRGTLEAYEHFIKHHAEALILPQAIAIRDSIAFAALADAAHSSYYKRFMIKHPHAQQYTKAQAHYETRRFEELYVLPHLNQFQDFLKEFPQSNYRDSVTFSLLQMMSLEATPSSFIEFLRAYPTSTHLNLAIQLLSSIDKAWHQNTYQPHYVSLVPALTDSLHQAITEPSLLLPIGTAGAYRFIDLNGTELPTTYDQISESYFCKGLSSSHIFLHRPGIDALYTRNGTQVLEADIHAVDPLSEDFLRITLNSGQGLWHLSAGQLIPPIYEAIWPLPSGLFCIKRDARVGLCSILHAPLVEPIYESIKQEGPFLVMQTAEDVHLSLAEATIRAQQEGKELPLFAFDQLQIIDSSYVVAQTGTKQQLLDRSLNVLLSVSDYQIEKLQKYWLLSKNEQPERLFNERNKQLSPLLPSLVTNSAWIILKEAEEGFGLLAEGSVFPELRTSALRWGSFMGDSILRGYDSLHLVGKYLAVGHLNTEQLLYFPGQLPVSIAASAAIYELHSSIDGAQLDHTFYRIVDEDEVHLLNHQGQIISTEPHIYTPISKDYIIVEKSAKEKGIINAEGTLEVPLIHKAISYPNKEGFIPLLHKGQFGLFDTHTGTYLPAQYQSIPTSFGPIGWKVQNRKKAGVISPARKAIVSMLYQDLEYCGPNYYIASRKHGFFVHYYDKKEQKGPFSAYKCLSAQEGYTLLQEQKKWGLLDQDARWLIPPLYDQIVAIGAASPAAFLAHRYIEDADMYLSIYFSKSGSRIFSETHAEPPPHFFCNNFWTF